LTDIGRQSGCFDDIPSLSARHPPSRSEGDFIDGCLLAVFNYSDTLLAGQMASNQWFKVIQRTLRGVVVLALMADANSG
jgi:hypothetical protein